MGRTKRKRNKNKQDSSNPSLGNDQGAVNLRRWLKQNDFTDPLKLQLRHFSDTGRGVTSKQSVRPSDVLMRVPFDLLITFDTVRKSELVHYLKGHRALTIQTLLALFLVMERHKGDKSKWKGYIDSLPYPEPLLPWMCQPNEVEFHPEDLKTSSVKLQSNFEESLGNIRIALMAEGACKCCGYSLSYLLDISSFKWAYTLVNTRAVYVDPHYIMDQDNSNSDLLSDEPLLALCPYLDLINHHHEARTKATIISLDGRVFYQLTTMTGFKKYEQFFISYGAHSNEKLLMEYGFFIPGNIFDSVKVSFKEILNILNLSLDERQYKYIKNYEFDADEIYINQNGVSFVLRAILFVAYHPKILNYGSFIFSNRYPSDFNEITVKSTESLLNFKLAVYKNDLERSLESQRTISSECGKLMNDFLEYRVKYVQRLLQLLEKNKLTFS